MKYAKIVNTVVEQIQPNAQDGFIEVSDDVVCGMIKNEDGTFSVVPKTDAELLEQAKADKWSNANAQIEKLKIGYLSGSTFVAKFGYEIDGYPADDAQLYDVTAAPALVDVNAHIYKASKDGLRAMADKAALLAPETTVNWYEDWQTFTTDKVCLDVVAARTTKEHQLILDTVVGV